MKKIYIYTLLIFCLIISCSNEIVIVDDDKAVEEETPIISNNITFDSFEILGRSIDVEFDGKHIWVAHYEDSKISKIDVDGNVLKVVDVDSSGRLLIPKDLLLFAKLNKEVVLSSSVNMIEIWDKEDYEISVAETLQDFDKLTEDVMGINSSQNIDGIS